MTFYLMSLQKKLEERAAMNNIKFYTPAYIPPEIAAYEGDLLQLEPGKAGKIGALVLKLEESPDTRKTVITDQFSRVPLFAQRALYMEESRPSIAYVFIMTPSGGILQGDRYRIDLSLSNNAQAHVTTQGATRLYRMERNYASQIVNIIVDDNCYLEYVPDQIIPYVDSRFYQTVNARVHDSGAFVYSEMLTPGRVASNEAFQYDILYMTTKATNQDGKLRFTDAYILEPKKVGLLKVGLLGDYAVVGNLYSLTKSGYNKQLIQEISNCLKNFASVEAGVTLLPNDSGTMTRILGKTADEVRAVIFEAVRIIRKTVIDAPFSGIRKY
jgi:urease accessory protein